MNRIAKERAGKLRAGTAIRTHAEVAKIMTAKGYPMSKGRVYQIEKQAVYKLRAALADLAEET
jgi:DNA-directed RNA polymerase sigma subunit (sigma70/sigma32)